jgi:hypothetical protein
MEEFRRRFPVESAETLPMGPNCRVLATVM